MRNENIRVENQMVYSPFSRKVKIFADSQSKLKEWRTSICCLLPFIFYLVAPQSVYGRVGDAGTYGAFLSYWGTSARALGMAGSFTGLADDASAMYFNPAGLVQLNTHEITFTHSIIFSGNGTSANVLMYAQPLNPTSGFGLTLFHIHTPGIKYTPPDQKPTDPHQGRFYTNRELTGALTYSRRLLFPVWIGVTGKIYQHSIFMWSGVGFGGDVGLYFYPARVFSFGINVVNTVKPTLKLIEETNLFPSVVRLGLSIRPWREKFILTGDMIWSEYRKQTYGVGIEFRPLQMLHVRGGCNEAFATVGLGLWKDRIKHEIKADYAFKIPHLAGNMFGFGHTFSLSVLFGGYRVKAHAPIEAFSPTLGEEGRNVAWLHLNIRPRTEVAKWEVIIKDEIGTVVKKIESPGEPPYRLVWDGTDENSLLVADGNYYYTLRVVEKDGRGWDFDGFLGHIYWVPPDATIELRGKEKKPTHHLEEPKANPQETDERRRDAERRMEKERKKERERDGF